MKILSNEDWDIHCDIMKEQNKRIDDLKKEKDEQIQIILTYEKVCELISAHSNYHIYAIMNIASKNNTISKHGLETVIVLIDRRHHLAGSGARQQLFDDSGAIVYAGRGSQIAAHLAGHDGDPAQGRCQIHG